MPETKPFEFATEFTRNGEILSGQGAAYKRVEEVSKEVDQARTDTQTAVMASLEARIAQSMEAIASNLTPSKDVMAHIAEKIRNDAIDLALTAAKLIANRALDENGHAIAADAVAQAVKALPEAPELIVMVSPEAKDALELRLANMPNVAGRIRFEPDPAAKPGDWRIEFTGGGVGYDRDSVIETVENCLDQRKADPVEDQLELFGAA